MLFFKNDIYYKSNSILWETTHEPIAVEVYKKQMEVENNASFIVNEAGLIVSDIWPKFGPSPDRLVFGECCLGECLEVKCPYIQVIIGRGNFSFWESFQEPIFALKEIFHYKETM